MLDYAERVAFAELDPWYQEHIARYTYSKNFELGHSVLDIACGNGVGSDLISKQGRKVLGVDQDLNTIQLNEKTFRYNSNLTFKVGNAEKLDLEIESFSSVISFETIEHLAVPENFLKEISRILRPDGLFLLSTPNALVTKPVNGIPKNPFHIKEYTPDELIDLVSRHFEVITIKGQFVSPSYRFNYYWNPERLRFLNPRYYMWLSLHRLFKRKPIFVNNLSKIFFKQDLYPGPEVWLFSEEQISTSHDLFVVCKKRP